MGYGCCIGLPKSETAHLRLVCGNKDAKALELPSEKRFICNNNETVTDTATGLMWMRDETPLLSLVEALKYCRELRLGGYNDWQLPNIKELATIINLSEGRKWFYEKVFTNTNTMPRGFYISSTTFDGTFGWGCNFQFGFDGYYADRRNGLYPFRPVRKI